MVKLAGLKPSPKTDGKPGSYLKTILPEAVSSSSESESEQEEMEFLPRKAEPAVDAEMTESEEEESLADAPHQDEEEEEDFDAARDKQFAYKAINDEKRILQRLNEIRQNFYNRLSSAKLIKNTKGRIPFTEHMTVTNEKPLFVPEGLAINDDIKREIAFYNMTRENVKKGMEILIQAKVPISRPDDFFAEMLKSDEHMAKVKKRLVEQQQKVKSFEDKRQKFENKKFHKAIKAYKQTEKHKEKRQNVDQINTLKKRISEKQGEDVDEKEFNRIFNGGSKQTHGGGKRKSVIDRVKEGQNAKK